MSDFSKFPADFHFNVSDQESTNIIEKKIRQAIYERFVEAIMNKYDYFLVDLLQFENDTVKKIINEIFEKFKYIGFTDVNIPVTFSYNPLAANKTISDKIYPKSILRPIVKYTNESFKYDEIPLNCKQFVVPITEKFINVMNDYYMYTH